MGGRASRVTLVGIAVLALAAGCSGKGPGRSAGSTATSASTSTPASPSNPGRSTTTSTRPSTSAASSTLPPDAGDHGPDYFSLPSNNIGCYLSADQVRCDAAQKTWVAPPPPTPCELEYGHGVALPAGGPPYFVCAGDTTLGGPDVLAYGDSAQRGHLRCDSSQAGVTCVDLSSGHGFFLSRATVSTH